jgi:hypothetical protein
MDSGPSVRSSRQRPPRGLLYLRAFNASAVRSCGHVSWWWIRTSKRPEVSSTSIVPGRAIVASAVDAGRSSRAAGSPPRRGTGCGRPGRGRWVDRSYSPPVRIVGWIGRHRSISGRFGRGFGLPRGTEPERNLSEPHGSPHPPKKPGHRRAHSRLRRPRDLPSESAGAASRSPGPVPPPLPPRALIVNASGALRRPQAPQDCGAS